jgi:predicted HD phosphohydrolase
MASATVTHARDAVAVRRRDDEAKDPSLTPPEFGYFEALLRALLKRGPLSS